MKEMNQTRPNRQTDLSTETYTKPTNSKIFLSGKNGRTSILSIYLRGERRRQKNVVKIYIYSLTVIYMACGISVTAVTKC